MPSKDRRITPTDRAWYRLGKLDSEQPIKEAYNRGVKKGKEQAEQNYENRIHKVCATNHQLLIEMLRLDRIEPVVGVHLTFDFANSLILRLREFDKNSWHASRIKHFINKADSEWCDALEGLESELIGAVEE